MATPSGQHVKTPPPEVALPGRRLTTKHGTNMNAAHGINPSGKTKVKYEPGTKLFRLTLVAPVGKSPSGGKRWTFKCDCGRVVTTVLSEVVRGKSKSCGCFRHESLVASHTTHGMSFSPEYRSWVEMKRRCYNHKSIGWKNYGGRGITVCERWINNFKAFLDDMGLQPFGTSIDRIDSNGPYCNENCRWATAREQGSNRKSNRLLTMWGFTFTLGKWAAMYGLNKSTLLARVNRGWSLSKALTAPVKKFGITT